jgi:VCBS repeat-containing protein
MAVDGTPKDISFTITGVNDAAVIGDPSNNQVTEDAGNIVDGFITLTGEITVEDADNGEAFFQTDVISLSTNKGSLDLNRYGSYTYKVSNADLQSLNASDHPNKDVFTIFAKDGTEKTIFITINGADDIVNSAPVVKELGIGDNKYAGSANVEELINLKYDNPIIAKYVARGGDFDYLHVRTGQFSFSDADLADKDKFTITSKAASLEGNLGTLTFDDYTNAKNSSGTIIDGEYIVKWTYTVKDRDLESLNTPAAGSSSKDDDFIVTIGDGTTTIDTKIMLNLSGRDEIEFVAGINNGNNVYEGTDEPNFVNFKGNDVMYLGNGIDYFLGDILGFQTVYGENDDDYLYSNSQNSVLFGGDGNDLLASSFRFLNGLFFGGNGNDTFRETGSNGSLRNTYAWGGAGSDYFAIFYKNPSSIIWAMDFDMRNPDVGGDKIDLLFGITDFNWDASRTELEKKSADKEHPILSEGAEYYELRVNTSTDENIENWFSVLNIVGIDGTEITLQGLIDNKNLI